MFDALQDAFETTGYDQLEVYAEEEQSISCGVSKGSIDSVESETSRGIGVRALVDSTVGFAYTNDPAHVVDAAERAIRLARLSQFRTISFPIDDSFPDVDGIYDAETAGMSEDTLVERTKGSLMTGDAVFSEGKVSRVRGSTYLMNSSGIEVSYDASFFVTYLSANHDGRSKHWFDAARSMFDPVETAQAAIDLLDATADPVTIEKGSRDVVLSPYAQYQIFSGILYPAFDADRVQRGKSPLEGREGEQVASDDLSLYDDGRKEAGINTRPFDREGTPTRRSPLIEDGVLEGFLYDVQRAEKQGIESTGNATGGYSNMPHIQPTNVIVEGAAGDRASLEDGTVYIHDVAGVHTANTTSGDFSLNITTGFVIEDGNKTPVRNGMFTGNIFELLESYRFSYGEAKMVDSLTSRRAVFADQSVIT